MGDACNHVSCTMNTRRRCRTDQGSAAADQIVDHDTDRISHLTGKQIAIRDPSCDASRRMPSTGLCKAFSRACRNRSARFPPPKSGETTLIGLSPAIDLIFPISSGAVVSAMEGQRNAFSKAASLCTSSVTIASVPTASNTEAKYRIVTGSFALVRRSLRAYQR